MCTGVKTHYSVSLPDEKESGRGSAGEWERDRFHRAG